MSGEFMFYGGLIVAGVAIIAGICVAVILMLRWNRLSKKLDAEYGVKGR